MIPLFVIIYKLFLTISHPSYWATLKLFLPINLVLINNTLFFYFEIFPEEYLHLVYLWVVGNQTKWSIVCHEIDLALFQQVTSFEVFVALLSSESFIVCLFVCYLTGPVQSLLQVFRPTEFSAKTIITFPRHCHAILNMNMVCITDSSLSKYWSFADDVLSSEYCLISIQCWLDLRSDPRLSINQWELC